MEKYEVYIKTNSNGEITAVNSSEFISNYDGWIKIDEGYTTEYHHAQCNYFLKNITDIDGIYNYKLIDGVVVERTNEDKQIELDKINYYNEIVQLKNKLLATDYIAAKLAEGAATKEEYATEIAERASWRARINELENMI